MSSSSNARSGPKYEATAAHLRKVLDGFSTAFDDTQLSGHAYVFSVPRSKLPTAVLAHEVMVIFGAVYLGREEKMEWQYGFTVRGIPCNLASTKWGLRLCLDAAVGDPEASEHFAQRVFDKLSAAQRVVNKSVLQPQLDSQIKAGNVTIVNQYATLRESYEYFREGAERAYAGEGRLASSTRLIDLMAGPGTTEGWWNTLAMVSAYFSTFEHILIGCLPFTSFDPAKQDLVSVIEDSLKDKMKRIMNVDIDPEAMRQFNALRDIVDRFRNTYSHGAFGHGGRAAMAVHLPDVGAVPVTLGEYGVRPELIFIPAVKDDFDQICAVFDSSDDWLANGPLTDGYQWVKDGLDFRFDAKFRTDAATARSKGRFEWFINVTSLRVDRAMNMEF